MWKKTVILVLIILTAYGAMLMNDPAEGIKMAGYNSLLKFYGDYRLREDDTKILYNPGLRKMNIDLKQAKIKASLPNRKISYARQLENFLQSDGQVLVECSGLDSWHSSSEGSRCLPRLRAKAYRVVIFDGGHHLPTLGLAPDLIIVPVYKGYAVHGYMQDGMQVSKLLELLKKSHSQTILVTVSRWRLVKTEASLTGITGQVLSQLNFSPTSPEPINPASRPRITKGHSQMFIYINKDYVKNPDLLIKNCRQLGLKEIENINIAFDYACIAADEADPYTRNLQKKLARPVERVNEPLKVIDLMLP